MADQNTRDQQVKGVMESGRGAAQRMADAGRQTADEATRTTQAVADEAARTSQRAARAGAEIVRSGAETVQHTMQSSLDMARQAAERSADGMTRFFGLSGDGVEHAAKASSKDISAVFEANAVIARGAQEVSNEWLNAAQTRFQKNLDAFNEILRCRSPQDLIAVQSRLVRDGLEGLLASTRRVSEISIGVAEQATQKIKAAADHQADQARHAA